MNESSLELLTRFRLSKSVQLENFFSILAEVYYPARVSYVSGDTPLSSSIVNAVTSPEYSVGYVRCGVEAEIEPDRDSTLYHVNLPISGKIFSLCRGMSVDVRPGTAVVFSAGEQHLIQKWEAGADVLGIKFGRNLLEGELSNLIGYPVTRSIKFHPRMELDEPKARSWAALVQGMTIELNTDGGVFDISNFRSDYIRLLSSGLLQIQHHSYSEALSSVGSAIQPRVVRRAQDFIESNLGNAVTLGDIASAAGCSARRLQEVFSETLGVTPIEYLRNARLKSVRSDLLDSTDSVTDIARRWGFMHLGRFSGAYRQFFGELPSSTARPGRQGLPSDEFGTI